MNMFIIFISIMVMGSQAAPITSDSTKENTTTTSYSIADKNGLLKIAYLQAIHTEQSVTDLEREIVSP